MDVALPDPRDPGQVFGGSTAQLVQLLDPMQTTRTRPRAASASLFGIFVLVLLALVGGPGCSSGGGSGGTSAPAASDPPVLSGVFTTADDGDFAWIDFLDGTTYALWKNAPCATTNGADDSCGQQGTYLFDGTGNLTLTSASTGTVTHLALQQITPATADTANSLGPASLRPLGLVGGDAGVVGGGSSLVSSQNQVATFQATGSSGKTQTLKAAADLSIGVFGECGLDGALKPLLGSLMHVLESKGIDLSAELLIVYNKELNSGENTLEILFGGGGAATAATAAGLAPAQLASLLENFGGEAGLLAGATISLDFDGTFGNVHWSFDAYSGADLYAASGGRWKLIWSQDPSEIGETGYWASITVASGAVCKGGAVVFASDGAITTLWNLITGGPTPPARPPVCGVPSTGSADCDACTQATCCAQANTCSTTNGCPNLYQCYAMGPSDWSYTLGCNLGAASGAKAPAQALQTCMEACQKQCGTTPSLVYSAP
jgi:hypothetical protein